MSYAEHLADLCYRMARNEGLSQHCSRPDRAARAEEQYQKDVVEMYTACAGKVR